MDSGSGFIPLGLSGDTGDTGTQRDQGRARWREHGWGRGRGRGGRGRWGNLRRGFDQDSRQERPPWPQDRERGRGFSGPEHGHRGYQGRPGSHQPWGQQRFKRGGGSNSSDGGSADNISLYYHPSMVQDPWRDLERLFNPSLDVSKQHSEDDVKTNLGSLDNEVCGTEVLSSEQVLERHSDETRSHSSESVGSVTP